MSIVESLLRRLGILPEDGATRVLSEEEREERAARERAAKEVSERVRRGDRDAPETLSEYMRELSYEYDVLRDGEEDR